jgi:hypothetical protein
MSAKHRPKTHTQDVYITIRGVTTDHKQVLLEPGQAILSYTHIGSNDVHTYLVETSDLRLLARQYKASELGHLIGKNAKVELYGSHMKSFARYDAESVSPKTTLPLTSTPKPEKVENKKGKSVSRNLEYDQTTPHIVDIKRIGRKGNGEYIIVYKNAFTDREYSAPINTDQIQSLLNAYNLTEIRDLYHKACVAQMHNDTLQVKPIPLLHKTMQPQSRPQPIMQTSTLNSVALAEHTAKHERASPFLPVSLSQQAENSRTRSPPTTVDIQSQLQTTWHKSLAAFGDKPIALSLFLEKELDLTLQDALDVHSYITAPHQTPETVLTIPGVNAVARYAHEKNTQGMLMQTEQVIGYFYEVEQTQNGHKAFQKLCTQKSVSVKTLETILDAQRKKKIKRDSFV